MVGGDPRFVGTARVPTAGDHRGLDTFAPPSGDAFDVEDCQWHWIIVPIMAARVTLKAVNDELARRGHHARLEKASGYFYFWSEDSAGWIDRTVRVPRLNSLTLDQWIGQYLWLKKINAEMLNPNRVKPWINVMYQHRVRFTLSGSQHIFAVRTRLYDPHQLSGEGPS